MKKVLAEKLHLHQEMELEMAHRTRKPRGNRPRPIAIKFQRYKDSSSILWRTKSLKGSKIYINEDFADAVRKRRRRLMLELKNNA